MFQFPYYNGLVVKIDSTGIFETHRDSKAVFIKVMAGVNWETFVDFCIDRGFGGIENLTMIPGNVGTSPIQNIGAYGVELKDFFESLEAIDTTTRAIKTFTSDECQFGYRESFFKKQGKDRYIITSVTFKLVHTGYQPKLDYNTVKEELKNMGSINPQLRDVRNAIKNIRERKLPDPAKLGSAGSFFKNPVIPEDHYLELKNRFPDISTFPAGNKLVKISAGWLIEKAGWKGYKQGDAGVYANQALVLVNYGKASGEDILALSHAIQNSILEKFNVILEREVNLIR